MNVHLNCMSAFFRRIFLKLWRNEKEVSICEMYEMLSIKFMYLVQMTLMIITIGEEL